MRLTIRETRFTLFTTATVEIIIGEQNWMYIIACGKTSADNLLPPNAMISGRVKNCMIRKKITERKIEK